MLLIVLEEELEMQNVLQSVLLAMCVGLNIIYYYPYNYCSRIIQPTITNHKTQTPVRFSNCLIYHGPGRYFTRAVSTLHHTPPSLHPVPSAVTIFIWATIHSLSYKYLACIFHLGLSMPFLESFLLAHMVLSPT